LLDELTHTLKEVISAPLTPKSFGSCVEAMASAAPALKPVKMLSEMKLTSTLNRKSQASAKTPATIRAVSGAREACRAGSPTARPARVTPRSREMAEVGPTARWCDDPKMA
jgi:hypothetical protein